MKYLFITYGEPGWRGVQMRAIRIANYLPKAEVMFWNIYDSSFIEQHGFAVETKHPGLIHPNDIVFPPGTEVIVFADLPTNELFQYSVFKAAKNRNVKVVICDQLYRKGQLKESLFDTLRKETDLLLLNALSSFDNDGVPNAKIIPPQIEQQFSPTVRKDVFAKYEIPEGSTLLFASGYNEEVMKKIRAVTEKLAAKDKTIYTVVSGPSDLKSQIKEPNLLILPFISGEEYFNLVQAADVVLLKFGFLQILESLALRKPTVVLGEAGYLLKNPDTLDQTLKDALQLSDSDEETFAHLEKLVSDKPYREKVTETIEQLHDGSLAGAETAAVEIMKLAKKPMVVAKQFAKKLALLVNNEIVEKEAWLSKQSNVYPLCVVCAVPTTQEIIKRMPKDIVEKKLSDFQSHEKGMLPHSFRNLLVFSERKYDGLIDITDWYDDWIMHLQVFLVQADEIYITELGEKIFGALIDRLKARDKIRKFTA